MQLAYEIQSRYPDKSVTLFESCDRILQECSPKTSSLVSESLKSQGIEVSTGERVVYYDSMNKTCVTASGRNVDTDLLFWCTGEKPNSQMIQLPGKVLDEKGYVKVSLSFIFENLTCSAIQRWKSITFRISLSVDR